MKGYVHSFQSMGAVDGPGIRFVVFLQGCPLRCAFCHNPDSWHKEQGQLFEASEIIEKVKRYTEYFGKEGGITLSGGEPLMQPEFATEIFRLAKEAGINTCLDTSGNFLGEMPGEAVKTLLSYTDLVISDIKHADTKAFKELTLGSLEKTRTFLKLTEEMNIPLWIRHVVVPGITDSTREVLEMAGIANNFKNLKKIELLPFHKMCESKYEQLGITFSLKDTPECSKEKIQVLTSLITAC